MGMSDDTWRKFKAFLKLYIGMEEWFHDSNNKAGVIGARSEIAKVLRSLKTSKNIKKYNWAFVHFEEEDRLRGTAENNYYSFQLLGLTSTASLIHIRHIQSV